MATDSNTTTDLQFEKAEYVEKKPGELNCAVCHQPIANSYYAAGDKSVCLTCREEWIRTMVDGSRVTRFVRAVIFGIPAAAAGAAIYYGIAAATGYEIGLVAILIGMMVGGAVRYGSRGRGGFAYQALAVGLTYVAIVSTYIPPIIEGFRSAAKEEQTAGTLPENGSATQPTDDLAPQGTVDSTAADIEVGELGIGGMMVALGLLLVVAMAAPFLAGAENFMGLIIIAIGLYEAWKVNVKSNVQLSGPYELSASPPIVPSVPL